MRFPTTPILDTGNRANETPLSNGGMWGTAPWWSDNMLILEGQQFRVAAGDPVGYAGAEHTVQVTGAVELYVDVSSASLAHDSSDYFELDLIDNASVDLGAPDGYVVGFATNPSIPTELSLALGRYDAGTFTALANSGLNLVSGDAVGITVDPATNLLRAYRRNEGRWSQVMQATDGTYNGPWRRQFGIIGETIRLDNIGGGTPT